MVFTKLDLCVDAIDVIAFFMKVVVAQFKLNEEHDRQTGSDAEGKTEDVDAGIEAVLDETPESDVQVTSDHRRLVMSLRRRNAHPGVTRQISFSTNPVKDYHE